MPFKSQRNSREDNSRKSRSNSESFKSKDNSNKKFGSNKSDSYGKSSFSKDRKEDNKSFGKSPFSKFSKDDKKSFGRPSFGKSGDRDENKSFGKSFDRKPFSKSFDKEGGSDRKSFDRKPFGKSFDKEGGSDRKSFSKSFDKEGRSDRKPYGKSFEKDGYSKNRRPEPTSEYQEQREKNDFKYSANRKFRPANKPANKEAADDGLIRLNRYISNAGICSRRKADELITAGVVSVNGEVVTSLGTKVDPAKDEIRYNNERLKREKMVYVLLNKPKDYITTTDDPQERRTVMQLVAKATKERIYPVGRLDRNTTGLLLLTNDGNLAEKLSHPRNNVTKIYQVELNKNLTQGDFNKIQFGIELEDGVIKPDDLSYVAGASKREVGIQIHSGKNRIVRRIFESLGYEVVKLDRVVYANLTKKDLPRGRWRYLEERELIQLKHFVK
ncbi:pseudouridine synthase [Sphingobacterium composti Ten et al. 2007 non Yoo et al. 2007]|uniref:pseudouridine synthase n=1 Tax=Sphingobacterium composti TaxID=363260 RepID=UPI0013598D82|nr:pseudouridine synthase [Sphingobacterium composti Ten et al. 2007 non Yoo et al. 2007]